MNLIDAMLDPARKWMRNEPTSELPFWMLQAASAYYSVLPQKFIDDAGEFLPSYIVCDIIKASIP